MSERIRIIAILGSVVIRILGLSWRIRYIDEDQLEKARQINPSVIFAFWHGRLFPLSFTHRGQDIQVLASEHRDGETMGQTIRRLGFGHVRGSSTRGGARAIRELVAKLDGGLDLGITVDGPKGPRYVVKPGPLEVAKLSGAPIVPITASSARHWTFDSWDAFEVPKPFTHVFVRYGEPVLVPADASAEELEERRLALEQALKAITEMNDDAFR
ncbi:MAG: DUF374 domain-containing protein [Candidatus Latescibacteria bacterium]|nr:DUF374 domain-containing protein [Candidatus Latescibacterota bacterium]NIM20939.1 DUF374 domain-containing protein [Candidatus Latescibacterota bacterium]NIM65074.1 DUF374 domain-containing protein [Candidatus Latescibacterota bacterium]NIO01589.1 DUF374 domain-containing protein [Candidatus Latescibacterota bacterium]NIO28106.1 DUF374 domain-containing protein [Candidatus Latescibacterota bacterium]